VRPDAPTPANLALPLREPCDLDPLIERIATARVVCLGEASHGTHEYYRWRAEITARLITEHGFDFVAVEGDWPDCWEVNAFVRDLDGAASTPREVLAGFERWPAWMWANTDVEGFVGWLRDRNAGLPVPERVGFYGFDVYSLWESLEATLGYLAEHEPEAVQAAHEALRCFEPYGQDPQAYASATRIVPESCEGEVIALLTRICEGRVEPDGGGPQMRFAAEQNAAVARNAERYYRAMVRGGASSWNVRDTHMADTLDRLLDHHGPDAKGIVWAHNTHVGDARHTDMAADGLVNVGQLARERHGIEQVALVGFGGHDGTVVAAPRWGTPHERMVTPPARQGSVEALLHDTIGGPALLVFPPRAEQPAWLTDDLGHRAIGVVYHPEHERHGNYVPSVLGSRYDAFLYLDSTRALHPLGAERSAGTEELQTFPHAV
jgi:erythromycin esterase